MHGGEQPVLSFPSTPSTSAAARPASSIPPTSRASSPPSVPNSRPPPALSFRTPTPIRGLQRFLPMSVRNLLPGTIFARSDGAEATLEADPETITPEKAAAWLAAGINRISLGVQSFHDAELKAAGRMHRRDDVFSAIACLRSQGFANISLDLIAGLPLSDARKLARLPRRSPAPPPRAHLHLSLRGR